MGHLPTAVCSSCFSYRCYNCGWSSSVLSIQFFIVSRWSKNMWLVRNTGHNATFIDLYCPLGLWMNDCISRSITLKDGKRWHKSKTGFVTCKQAGNDIFCKALPCRIILFVFSEFSWRNAKSKEKFDRFLFQDDVAFLLCRLINDNGHENIKVFRIISCKRRSSIQFTTLEKPAYPWIGFRNNFRRICFKCDTVYELKWNSYIAVFIVCTYIKIIVL